MMINKKILMAFAGLAFFSSFFLPTLARAAAPAGFPLRIYIPAFEDDGIDAIISRAKTMNADALVLSRDDFSVAEFSKANNIKNNNGVTIKPVLWTDITMSHQTYVTVDMNILANRVAAAAQLEQDIIDHPGIFAVELEETGHDGYTTASMDDLLTKARDAAHKHGVQFWINQPTMSPWSYNPPAGGWDVDYINTNKLVDAYILQNGDAGDTSTGAIGNFNDVLSTQNGVQARMPNTNVISGAYGWTSASVKTPKCGETWSVPECYVQSLFTMVNYFNSRGMPVQIGQVDWSSPADYYYYDTAGYGTGTVLQVMSRIPVKGASVVIATPALPTVIPEPTLITTPVTKIALNAGWNQISSAIAEGIDIATIEKPCVIVPLNNQKLWSWDGKTQSWTNPARVEPFKGYWINIARACTVPLSGTPAKFTSVELYPGWNNISASGVLSAIKAACNIVGSQVWNWDTVNNNWTHPSSLRLDKGYWINITGNCILG